MNKTQYKIVPIEPTKEMIDAACRDGVDLEGRPVWKHTFDVQAKWKYQQMLDAAPDVTIDLPTMTYIGQRKLDELKLQGYKVSGYSIYNDKKHQHAFVTAAGLVGWWSNDTTYYKYNKLLEVMTKIANTSAKDSGSGHDWVHWQEQAETVLKEINSI